MADEITIYVDETYLDDGGEIQAGVPIPAGCETAFDEAVDSLLRGPPRQQLKWFHGQRLRSRNQSAFQGFLQYGTNVCALVGEATPLRPVVTLRGPQAGAENLQWLRTQVEPAAKSHAVLPDGLFSEIVKQSLWIHEIVRKVCPVPVPNPFRLVFDNKHRYAKEMNQPRTVLSDGMLTTLKAGRICTAILNVILRTLARDEWCPRISSVAFLDDKASRPLQLADLLCNLTYNALLYEKGCRTDKMTLKHSVLRAVLPASTPVEILEKLDVVDGNLVCSDQHLRMDVVLEPVPE